MTTFADSGKEINDLFTREFPEEKILEVNFRPNPEQLSVTLKGKFKGDSYEGFLIPTFRYRPWGLEAKAEISSPDDNDKTLKMDVHVADVMTPGLKGEVNFINGRKGELSIGGVYRNIRFGGITAKLGFPIAAHKFLAVSLQIENPDTNGVGVGGSVKVVNGEEVLVESWKGQVSYRTGLWNGFLGVEQKEDKEKKKRVVKNIVIGNEGAAVKVAQVQEVVPPAPSNALFLVGGIMKRYDFDKTFAINGNYNTTRDITNVEFLFKKTFEDFSYYKIKADCEGKIHTSRQFNVSHGSIVVGTEADIIEKTGSITLHVSTNF